MHATKLLYLDDMSLHECIATVMNVAPYNENLIAIVLDQTIFYPQGGGQPYDTGEIRSSAGVFRVEEVRKKGAEVLHIGQFVEGNYQPGESIRCSIDTARRKLNERYHSGGHLIDAAAERLEISWTPIRASHFPESAFIEYQGNVGGRSTEQLKNALQEEIQKILKEDSKTEIISWPKKEVQEKCRYVPAGLPDPVRLITWGNFKMPCGGTHVAWLHEIGNVHIKKAKFEKEIVRVSYTII